MSTKSINKNFDGQCPNCLQPSIGESLCSNCQVAVAQMFNNNLN